MNMTDVLSESDLRDLDGDDADMFPLRDAKATAKILDCSPDHVHDLWATGRLPYVLLPSARSGPLGNEGRRRRIRDDHLRKAVADWTRS
jgi:hypothetical protein